MNSPNESAPDPLHDLLCEAIGDLAAKTPEPTKEPAESPLGSAEDSRDFGSYRLLDQLGHGGFGVVWLAQQVKPIQREVALKVIKPGMDSREIIARFEAERQTLAMMDHPHIAAVLDAGTTAQGRPYFVMELVKGIPITSYCDERQLTIRERIQLFIPVCQAVHHAHQKSVLHRDLKPTNILVTEVDGKPVPKVIDFGIAKALGTSQEASLLQTQAGAVIGTPQYMSPEQAGATPDLDTRSDIYALGVILYELLTGETPLARESLIQNGLQEVLRQIRETDPPKPSNRIASQRPSRSALLTTRHTDAYRLSRLLRGDLDWIVLKALEKDRTRRYESATTLADELGRYLRDEPVDASHPSHMYRFGKLVRRNRVAFAVGTFCLVLACIAVTEIVISLNRARMAEAAEAKRADSEIAVRRHLADQLEKTDHLLWDLSRQSQAEAWDSPGHRRVDNAFSHISQALRSQPTNRAALVQSVFQVAALEDEGWETRWRMTGENEVPCWVALTKDCGSFILATRESESHLEISRVAIATGKKHHLGKLGLSYGEPVALSPNGNFVVFADEFTVIDGTGRHAQPQLKLWNTSSWTQSAKLDFELRPKTIVFSDDDTRVGFVSWDRVAIIDAASGSVLFDQLRPAELDFITDLSLSEDGSQFALIGRNHTAPASELVIISAHEGRILSRQPVLESLSYDLQFSPKNEYLLLMMTTRGVRRLYETTLRVINLLDGTSIYGHSQGISAPAAAFSPDGRYLAYEDASNDMTLVELATGNVITHWSLEGAVTTLAFSSDGLHLAIGCYDSDDHGHLDVLSISRPDGIRLVSRTLSSVPVTVARFSPDGRWLYLANANSHNDLGVINPLHQRFELTVLEPASKPMITDRMPRQPGGFSADGECYVVREQSRVVFKQTTNGKVTKTIPAQKGHQFFFSEFGLDGKTFVLGSFDPNDPSGSGTITALSWPELSHFRTLPFSSLVPHWARLTSDCNNLVGRFDDIGPPHKSYLIHFDLATGRQVQRLQMDRALDEREVTLSPDGCWLGCVGSTNEARFFWSLTGEGMRYPWSGSPPVIDVEFSPNSSYFATTFVGRGYQLVELSPLSDDGKSIALGRFESLSFAPNSESVAIARREKIELISTKDGKCLWTRATDRGNNRATFHPAGQWIACCRDSQLHIHDAVTGEASGSMRLPGFTGGTPRFTNDGRWLVMTGPPSEDILLDLNWLPPPDACASPEWTAALNWMSKREVEASGLPNFYIPTNEPNKEYSSGNDWAARVLHWKLAPPGERTLSPWVKERILPWTSDLLLSDVHSVTAFVSTNVAPWHCLAPVAIAVREASQVKGSMTLPTKRTKYLCRLTLDRLRAAVPSEYGGADALRQIAIRAADLMNELNCSVEASEAATLNW